MDSYVAQWSNGEIIIPLEFSVDEEGAVVEFHPELLKSELTGAAHKAHINFQSLLRQVTSDRPTLAHFPSSVQILYRKRVHAVQAM